MYEREYNKGQNDANQGTYNDDLNPEFCNLKPGEVASESQSVYEIDSYDSTKNKYELIRPSEDNIPASRLLFCPAPLSTDAEVIAFCGFIEKGKRWVAFDDTEGEPELGDMVGTLKDSYKMSMHRFGFECLDYDSTNSLCLVRKQSFMPTLVQTVTDESGGEIDVKFVLADGTLVGDAFTVKVLPE